MKAQILWHSEGHFVKLLYQDFTSQIKTQHVKALLHIAIFLATCNKILPLGYVKLANTDCHYSLPLYCSPFFTNYHLFNVELRCKLQEKLYRVTEPERSVAMGRFGGANIAFDGTYLVRRPIKILYCSLILFIFVQNSI